MEKRPRTRASAGGRGPGRKFGEKRFGRPGERPSRGQRARGGDERGFRKERGIRTEKGSRSDHGSRREFGGPKREFSGSKSGFPGRRRRDEARDKTRHKISDAPDAAKTILRKRTRRTAWSNNAYKAGTATPGAPPVKPIVRDGTTAPVSTPSENTITQDTALTPHLERLQKVIARAGVASRRKAEELILEGAVTVNGRPVLELGTKVDASKDKIKVNGKLIHSETEPLFLALYKPKGVISSLSDPEGRPHIGQLLHTLHERVIPIGRLDFNSEGLILLTNDGDLAEKVQKSRHIPKVYMVKIKGHPTERDLEFLKRGIFTAEGVVRFASFDVEQALRHKSWLKLEISEGAQLDLRELLNHRGLMVDKIVRSAIGHISIKGIEPGTFKFLKRDDFEQLVRPPTR